MTDLAEDIPESGTPLIPEVVDDYSESMLPAEQNTLINDTILLINRTISSKALEVAFLIGDYILTNYFDDNMDAAFSTDSNKSISFSILCAHPALQISRRKLTGMVKVAAQQRFFRSMEVDISSLHYSHLEKLTILPNEESKIDMALECVDQNLTTRQLGHRIRMQTRITEPAEAERPAEPDPLDKTVEAVFSFLDELKEKIDSLNFNALLASINYISAETKGSLQYKLMTVTDTMDTAKAEFENLLAQLSPGNSEH